MTDWVDDLPHDAPALRRMVEQREQRAYDEGRTEVMDVTAAKVAEAEARAERVASTCRTLLAAIDEGRYNYGPAHVRSDLDYLRAVAEGDR